MTGLDFNEEPACIKTRELVEEEFDAKRAEGKLSRAHDFDHIVAVSNFAGVTARALMNGQDYDDMDYRASVLGAISGNLHDYHREAKETESHGPISAEFFKKLWVSGDMDMDTNEFDSVYRAIAEHEASLPENLEIFGSPIGRKQQILPAVIAFSLKTGDVILEASGFRVLERRAFFVGKERMLHGDLKEKFKYPEESDLAVIGETLRRLYGKLPIDSYPDWVKDYGEKLHSIQYLFLKGLLAHREFTEEEAVDFLEKRGFPRFEGIKDKVHAQRHLDGKHFPDDKYPVLSEEIRKTLDFSLSKIDNLAVASFNLVSTIANAESPEEGIDSYKEVGIQNPFRDMFYEGMSGYRKGSEDFVHGFETNVTDAVRRKAQNK
ncbi:MAG: hypothetical protein JSW41_04125 [Candidatus Aenigmatarchaeota archaeon]|nr:MAG: hypothetical protein JSW41_04125 [Candidatus Aenigmarchaeota archaeon]